MSLFHSFYKIKAPSQTSVDFHHLKLMSLHVCKIDIENERLELHKKRSLFAKWVIQNDSDALVAAHIK